MSANDFDPCSRVLDLTPLLADFAIEIFRALGYFCRCGGSRSGKQADLELTQRGRNRVSFGQAFGVDGQYSKTARDPAEIGNRGRLSHVSMEDERYVSSDVHSQIGIAR